jgi:hypothetical protein
MYCPKCGCQRIADETRFCSSCGFSLSGVTELIDAGGELSKESENKLIRSPRRKGIEQSAILLFVGILLLPFVNILTAPYHELLTFVFFIGGFLRLFYALIFQEGAGQRLKVLLPNSVREMSSQLRANVRGAILSSQKISLEFDEQQAKTAEMVKLPVSVTENTTGLLNKENDYQFASERQKSLQT